MVALTLSAPVIAHGQDESPPFDLVACKNAHTSILIQIKHYRQANGAGPAFIKSSSGDWMGGWNWQAADEGTRLTGYYHLTVKFSSFYLHTLYNPYGELSGGWLQTPKEEGPVECVIIN